MWVLANIHQKKTEVKYHIDNDTCKNSDLSPGGRASNCQVILQAKGGDHIPTSQVERTSELKINHILYFYISIEQVSIENLRQIKFSKWNV